RLRTRRDRRRSPMIAAALMLFPLSAAAPVPASSPWRMHHDCREKSSAQIHRMDLFRITRHRIGREQAHTEKLDPGWDVAPTYRLVGSPPGVAPGLPPGFFGACRKAGLTMTERLRHRRPPPDPQPVHSFASATGPQPAGWEPPDPLSQLLRRAIRQA